MDHVDCLVIGAGVVGLACARALAQAGREVVIVEREARYGRGVSSRNSEVIHAGLYDPPGSLKARLCVRGNRLLYDYCAKRGIAHRRCGKLVLATRAQDVQRLDELAYRAAENGVAGLQPLIRAQAIALEPALSCEAALWSPSSGIVDSQGLMTALLGDAEASGAALALTSAFSGAKCVRTGWQVRVRGPAGTSEFTLGCDWLINSAGLDAQAAAASIEGFPLAGIPRRHLAKGHYFSLAGGSPFSRLIYPMPVDGGLGVHLTLDLGGQASFGPDVQWLDSSAAGPELDYAVDPDRRSAFAAAVRHFWPDVPANALIPAYSGIRPKLSGPGEAAVDFHIEGPAEHGCHGLVQLFGIESPGLTASLAIGEWVAALVQNR